MRSCRVRGQEGEDGVRGEGRERRRHAGGWEGREGGEGGREGREGGRRGRKRTDPCRLLSTPRVYARDNARKATVMSTADTLSVGEMNHLACRNSQTSVS